MEIMVNILKNLILKLENEQLFYEENTKFLSKRKMEIGKKYYVGLKIKEFLDKIRENNRPIEDVKAEYQKFAKEKIFDTSLTFGDVFTINEEETTDENIAYGIRICRDSERYVPQIACEKLFQISEAHRTIGEKTIVNCLQIFEEYFAGILKALIAMKPEAYFYDKTIKYSLLINKNIKDLTNELIEQEVDKLMYAVSETIEKENKTHKLKLEKYQDIWDAYIELDLRRNIIVHNAGIVNQKYLSSLPERYTAPEDGSVLVCDDIYIVKSIETLIKFAYLLYYLIFDSEDDLSFLESTAFDFLCSEKWNIALFAYDLLLSIPTLTNEDKSIYNINRLIAKKHIDGLDLIKEEIDQFDVSGMENRYIIAKKLLLEEYQEVNNLLQIDYPKSFNFYMIQTWPLFIEYRNSDEYRAFIDEHQTEYATYELKEREQPICESEV